MASSTFALIQYSCSDKPEANIEKAENLIREAVENGANAVLLPELFSTTYFCREIHQKYFDWAEVVPGPATRRFSALAKNLCVVILLPLFEKEAPGIYYNTVVVIEKDGTILGKYRKMHIPDDPGFYEKYYFTPGDLGYRVFDTSAGKIGTLICWDQWFPEAARLTAMKGADILIYPTAIGTLMEEGESEKKAFKDAWLTVQRSHAIANGCYVAGINRVGEEGETSFWGHSFLSGPFGELIAEAGESEEILYVQPDFQSIEKQRQTWPFFRDRRIDSYGKLNNRFDQ